MGHSLGKFVSIDMSNVKTDADKSIKFLTNTLKSRSSIRNKIVVCLGEEHGNKVDMAITRELLLKPPIISKGRSRVIFERGLDKLYTSSSVFKADKIEDSDLGMNKRKRSTRIAKKIQDDFENDIDVVYVPCGSAHAKEIYDDLSSKCKTPFTYFCKMSSTDSTDKDTKGG